MIKKVLMENVNYTQEHVRHIGDELDAEYFNTLSDEQKASYSAGFEPAAGNTYSLIAKHKGGAAVG